MYTKIKNIALPLFGTALLAGLLTLIPGDFTSRLFQSTLITTAPDRTTTTYENPFDTGTGYVLKEKNAPENMSTNIQDTLRSSTLKNIKSSSIGTHTQIHGAGAGPYMAEYPNLVEKYSDMLDGLKLSGLRFFQGDLSFDRAEDTQKYWDAMQALGDEHYVAGQSPIFKYMFMSFVDYVRMSIGKSITLEKNGHFIFTVHAIYALDPTDNKAHYILENKEKYIPLLAQDNAKLVQRIKDAFGEAAFKNFYFEIGNEEYFRIPSPVYAEAAYASIQEMRKIVPDIKIAVVMKPMGFNGDHATDNFILFQTKPLLQFVKDYYTREFSAQNSFIKRYYATKNITEQQDPLFQSTFDNRALMQRLKELENEGIATNPANTIKNNLVGIQIHSYARAIVSGLVEELKAIKNEAGFEKAQFWLDEFNFYGKWANRGNENPTFAFDYLFDTLGMLMRPDVDFIGEHATPGSGLAEYRISGVGSDPDWEGITHYSADPFFNSQDTQNTFYRTLPLGIVHKMVQDAFFGNDTIDIKSYLSYKDIFSAFGTTANGAWRGILANKTDRERSYTLDNLPASKVKVYRTQTTNTENIPLVDIRDEKFTTAKTALTASLLNIHQGLVTKKKELYSRLAADTQNMTSRIEAKIADIKSKIHATTGTINIIQSLTFTGTDGSTPTGWIVSQSPLADVKLKTQDGKTFITAARNVPQAEYNNPIAPENEFGYIFQTTTDAPNPQDEYVLAAQVKMINYDGKVALNLIQNPRINANPGEAFPLDYHMTTWDKQDLSPTEWRQVATPRVKLTKNHAAIGVQILFNRWATHIADVQLVNCTQHPEFEGCYTEELRTLKNNLPKTQIELARDQFSYEHPDSYPTEVYTVINTLNERYQTMFGIDGAINTGMYATYAFRLHTVDLLLSKIGQYLRYENEPNATILLRDALRSVLEFIDTENTYSSAKVNQNQSIDQILGAGDHTTGVALSKTDRDTFGAQIQTIRNTLKTLMADPTFANDYLAFFRSEFLPKVEYTTLTSTGSLTLTLPPRSYLFLGDDTLEIKAEETLFDSLDYLKTAKKDAAFRAHYISPEQWDKSNYQNELYDTVKIQKNILNLDIQALKNTTPIKDIRNTARGVHVADLGGFRTFSYGRDNSLYAKAFKALGLDGLRHFSIDHFDAISEEVSRFLLVPAYIRQYTIWNNLGIISDGDLASNLSHFNWLKSGGVFEYDNQRAPVEISLQELTDLSYTSLKDKRVMMAINVAQAFDPEMAAIYKAQRAQGITSTTMDDVSFDLYHDKTKAKKLLGDRAVEILKFLKNRYGEDYYKTFIFEMGNEYWDGNYGYLDTASYFESCKAIIQAMHEYDPRVRTSVIFTAWGEAKTLSPMRYDIDGLTIHLYTDMANWDQYMNNARKAIAPFGLEKAGFWISEYDQDGLGNAQQKYWDSSARYIRSAFGLIGRKDVEFADFHNLPQVNFTSFIHGGENSLLDCRAGYDKCFLDKDELLKKIGDTSSTNPLKDLEREVWVTNFPGYVSKATQDILYGSGTVLQEKNLNVDWNHLALAGTTSSGKIRMAFANTDAKADYKVTLEQKDKSPLKIIRMNETKTRAPLWDITQYPEKVTQLKRIAEQIITKGKNFPTLLNNGDLELWSNGMPTDWKQNCAEGGILEDAGSTSDLSFHALRMKNTGEATGFCLYQYNPTPLQKGHEYIAVANIKNETMTPIDVKLWVRHNPNTSGGEDQTITSTITDKEWREIITPRLTVTTDVTPNADKSGVVLQGMSPKSAFLIDNISIVDCTEHPGEVHCIPTSTQNTTEEKNYVLNGDFESSTNPVPTSWNENCAGGGIIETANTGSGGSLHAARLKTIDTEIGHCLYQYNDLALVKYHDYVVSAAVKNELTTPASLKIWMRNNPNNPGSEDATFTHTLSDQNWSTLSSPLLHVTTDPITNNDKSGVIFQMISGNSSILIDKVNVTDCTLHPTDIICSKVPVEVVISPYVKQRLNLFINATDPNEIRKEMIEAATVLSTVTPEPEVQTLKTAFLNTIHSIPFEKEAALQYIADIRLDQMPSYTESYEYFVSGTTKELSIAPNEVVFVCEGECSSDITVGLLSSRDTILASSTVKNALPVFATLDMSKIHTITVPVRTNTNSASTNINSNTGNQSNSNSTNTNSTEQKTIATSAPSTIAQVLQAVVAQNYVGAGGNTGGSTLGSLPKTTTTTTSETLRGAAPIKESPFKDIKNHFAKSYIDLLYAQGILKGKTATTFAPNASLSRAEGAALISRLKNLENEAAAFQTKFRSAHPTYSYLNFTDVPVTSWFAGYVGILKDKGIISGINSSTFAPAMPMTRAEFMKLLLKDKTVNLSGNVPFSDVKKSDWYYETIQKAYAFGLIDKASLAFPNRTITRGEAAKMMSVSMGK